VKRHPAAEAEAQKVSEPLGEIEKKQSNPDHAAGGIFQARGNAAQAIGRFEGAERTFHRVAVADIGILCLFCSLDRVLSLGGLPSAGPVSRMPCSLQKAKILRLR